LNRSIHRILGIVAALLLLWIAGTGVGMQVLDLKAILTHESPTDPQELSMQEGMYGPNGFAIIQVSDFSAPTLPQDFDINRGIVTVLKAANAQQNQGSGPGGGPAGRAGGAAPYSPMAWVELRMANGIPIGQVMMGTRLLAFNALTGESVTPLPTRSIPQGGALPPSLRQRLKTWHRFWNRQDTPGVYVEFLAGLTLWTLVISGLVMYFRLWSTRWKQGRPQPFWLTGGGRWRATHRVVSIVAAVFLLWMSFTGTWIGFESSYGPIKRVFASKPVVLSPTAAQAAASVQQGQPQGQLSDGGQQGQPGGPGQIGVRPGQAGGQGGGLGGNGPGGAGGPGAGGPGGGGAGGRGGARNALDFILPLRDNEVREMTAVTLNSMQQIHPAVPIKAIRLRTYGQTKQGVVISGRDTTNQYVFNADSGQPASLNEQGYPASGFPFGTQVHENIKHLHSGDYFGIPARLMNLFGGFCLTFLAISGIVVYVDMWLKRRKAGRKSPVWL
jgi:uncharacterized iron-regulated membrane protein